jgi:hypothetical protein
MVRMRFVIKIMITPPPESESETEPIEPLAEKMATLEPVMSMVEEKLSQIIEKIQTGTRNLFLDPIVPQSSDIAKACEALGLAPPFSLKDWFQAILANSKVDLETRMITFPDSFPIKSCGVFELIRNIPVWFEI